jgi:hypothetical protein
VTPAAVRQGSSNLLSYKNHENADADDGSPNAVPLVSCPAANDAADSKRRKLLEETLEALPGGTKLARERIFAPADSP